MKKACTLFALAVTMTTFVSCKSSGGTTAVVKPRYHHTWAKNRYRIDIPVGARHIHMFERKRTKTMNMK